MIITCYKGRLKHLETMTSKELVPLNVELVSNDAQPNVEESENETRKMVIGVVIAILSAFCYVTGLGTFQRIHDAPPDFQLNLLRCAVGLILITVGLCVKGIAPRFSLHHIKWMLLAGAAYISFKLLMYKNEIRFLPLGTVGSLFNG